MSVDPSEDRAQHFHKKTVEAVNIKYPNSYVQELGKCIVEILADISSLDSKVLNTFCVAFQETCLQVFQQKETMERHSENIEQIIKFLSLLDQHAIQKGESWPLVYLVGPMLAKAFPSIRSSVSFMPQNVLTVTDS